MTKAEILKKLDELENRRFYLSMKDRWSPDDYQHDREMMYEEIALRKKLEVEA